LLAVRAAKNNFAKEAGVAIGAIASTIVSIKSLDLTDNNIGDEGVQSLAEGLYHNASIRKLNLNRNCRFQNHEKRNRMLQYLSEMLNSDTLKLESLAISGANKGNKDSRLKEYLIPLVSGLAENIYLTELDITGHGCGTQGAIAIARMLEVNQTLIKLSWDDNNTGLIGFQNIKKSLKLNNSLQEMPLPLSDISKLLNPHAHVPTTLVGGMGVSGAEKELRQELLKAINGIEKCLRENQQF